jgi:hypothetical protein
MAQPSACTEGTAIVRASKRSSSFIPSSFIGYGLPDRPESPWFNPASTVTSRARRRLW